MTDEQTIDIDGTEYKVSELSPEALALIQSLQFAEAEITRANAMVAVMTTAKAGYHADLKKALPFLP
jgi:hypothetical protein